MVCRSLHDFWEHKVQGLGRLPSGRNSWQNFGQYTPDSAVMWPSLNPNPSEQDPKTVDDSILECLRRSLSRPFLVLSTTKVLALNPNPRPCPENPIPVGRAGARV